MGPRAEVKLSGCGLLWQGCPGTYGRLGVASGAFRDLIQVETLRKVQNDFKTRV